MTAFPEKLHFRAVPHHIEAASLQLPKPKGSRRRARVNINDFRKRLIELPTDKLSQWKLKPAAQEYLPYVAAEKSNASLQRRVAILCLACFEQLQPNCAVRILLSMYDNPEICAKAQSHLKAHPRPKWLADIDALSPKLPDLLAQFICENKTPLHNALSELEIPSWSALGTAVYDAIPKHWDAEYIMELPASETLDWIGHSSAPITLRQSLMKALLRRYGSCIPQTQWIQSGKPLGNLIQTAMRIWPYPSALWKNVPKDAARAAHWIFIEQQLKQHLSNHELAFWRQAIEHIVEIVWLSQDQILLIELPQKVILQRRDQWLIQPKSALLMWKQRQWSSQDVSLEHQAWQEIPKTVNECMVFLKDWTAK